MLKGKIREILQEKLELKKKIENDRQSFLKKDAYLIFDEKQQFIDTINQSFRIFISSVVEYFVMKSYD